MTVSVCVSLSANISLEIHARSLPFFVHITYGCGLVLLCQHCDTLCTSGFMDDVILAHKPRQLSVAAQLMEAQPKCSHGLVYKCRLGIPFAGERSHSQRNFLGTAIWAYMAIYSDTKMSSA